MRQLDLSMRTTSRTSAGPVGGSCRTRQDCLPTRSTKPARRGMREVRLTSSRPRTSPSRRPSPTSRPSEFSRSGASEARNCSRSSCSTLLTPACLSNRPRACRDAQPHDGQRLRDHAPLRERPEPAAARGSRGSRQSPPPSGAERHAVGVGRYDSGSYMNSRSSCEHRHAVAIFAAHSTAASRDGSSRTVNPPSNSRVWGYVPAVAEPSPATMTGATSSLMPPPKT